MDRSPQQVIVSGTRVAFAALLTLASGCAGSGQIAQDLGINGTPVTQVAVMWSPQVVTGVDPVHQGAPMSGLAGRVFLWGSDLKENLIADGDLIVDLYATPPEQPQAPPACLQTWVIKKDDLNREYLRKDFMGQGYTLNLPWPGYRPDITQVQLRVHYQPAKGVPIYTQEVLALNRGQVAAPTYVARMETGDRQPIVAPPPAAPRQPAGPVQQVAGFQPPAQMPYQVPPQQPAGMQPAPYQAPIQQAGGFPQYAPAPPQQTPQQFPGAYQR
ncbi:MAG TPA: hypothetical protein VKA46_24215 [Gemmataceae bacterium]|nr:hypothetical protein [Gemmataceae bacterium]